MTYDVEIMLRANEKVFTETVHHIGGDDPAAWTVDDASTVLQSTLLAIDRALNPGRTDEPSTLTFRGINWIVSPHDAGRVDRAGDPQRVGGRRAVRDAARRSWSSCSTKP